MSKKFLMTLVLTTGILAGDALADPLVPIDPASVTDGHVYLFDNVGTDVPDDSANNHTANLVGSPQVVDGLSGKALQFNGTSDGVHIPDAATINTSTHQNHTVIAIFKCADVTKSEKQVVYEEGGTTRGLTIYVHEGLVYAGGWNLNDYTPEWTGTFLSAPINSNEWHAVSAVLRGGGAAQEDDKFEMWMDGELIAKGPGGELRSRSNDNGIGYANSQTKFHDGNFTGGGSYFEGVVDEIWIINQALTEGELSAIGVSKTKAKKPVPKNETIDVPRDGTLAWEPGDFADTHDVYLGTNFDDVNNATNLDPVGPDQVYRGRQSVDNYAPPQRLDFETTYYWRIDEVNAPPTSNVVFKGDVWSFTTEPVGYPVDGATITATASSSGQDNLGPENTINGSGLDADDLHSPDATDMWLSDSEPAGAWIQYEFDKPYKLHQMWVWNSNQLFEALFGFGLKDVTVEYSTDGTGWTTLAGVPEFARAPGADGYAHDTTVDFSGAVAKYVRLTALSNWGGALPQFGLSEVRFFHIPVIARGPDPADGVTDVSLGTLDEPIDVTVSFRRGREAATHEVYLDDNWRTVAQGTAPVATVTETSYGPLSLDLGKTYYWRVDEVNDTETPAAWQGDIWSFSTQSHLVIDDFEDYNDYPPDEIFSSWSDGYNDPTNGSLVANDEAPFAETSIVHGDAQAMPYRYDNSSGFSEATQTLISGRDWTQRGVTALSLWFRGYPASVSRFAEAPTGVYTLATRSPSNITGSSSDEFHFAYTQFSGAGSIIAKVEWVRDADDNAQAGVMIRDTLDPDAVHATILLETNDIAADWDLRFRRRTAPAADSSTTTVDGIMAPQWLKLERDLGSNVIASYSADGVTWTEAGREPITMTAPAYIGLVVASENAGVTCEAQFSNVQIVGASGAWSNQDIGIQNNDPEPMYVALANPGGSPAVVYYEDPEDPNVIPTQTGGWTEWNIDLRDFADQGVNLANVESLSIGFGDKRNPQPGGGKGQMYIDDIRLYPARCMPSLLQPSADLNDDCVVDHLEAEILARDWLKSDSVVATTAPDPAGLVLHYKFDGDATDSSGNNYHGIEMDGPTYVEGKFGQAIHLDGLDDYVAITELNYTGTGYLEATVCAWVRTSDGTGVIASFDRNEYWRLQTGGEAGDPGLVGWHVWTDTGQVDTQAAPNWPANTAYIDDGRWHHVAGVFDNGTLTIYIDGDPQESYFGGVTFGRGRYTRYGYVGSGSEGSYPAPNGRANGPYLEGDVDELYIYNRALSQAEIAYLADETPEDGELYVPVPSIANIYDDELPLARSVNFKDYALIADQWLEQQFWPAP